MLNTKHIQDLIKDGDISQVKDAMEQSMSPGSQTFEQALFHLYSTGQITMDEAMANSDSPSNLHWLINNASKTQQTGSAQTSSSSQPAAGAQGAHKTDDLSSIKLNLDALG
jgi:twitching motility protein PilU